MAQRAYKLLTKRKDGTLGPLFINAKQRIPIDEWLEAEYHPTKGYTYRPFWHVTFDPVAPHLTEKGRVWCEVEIEDFTTMDRCASQGGTWGLSSRMNVVRECPELSTSK